MRSCRRTLVEAIYDRDYGRVAGIWRSTSETSEVRVTIDIEVTDIGKVQIVRRKAVRVVASVLLAVSVAACGSSAEISDGDVETTTPRPETTAPSVAEPTLSTQDEETEESADGADSGGESTESEASAAETSSESSGSFIELLREDIEGQQDYFDLNSVGGSGESALLQAGCEVVGEITWVCPDEVDLSGADLSGMNLRFARMNQALLFGADLSGVDATGASFTDIYAPNANFSGATFTGASLDSATLYFATLSAADFSKAQMDSISLSGADLIGVNLADSNLVGSYLEYADLSNADVTNASIDSADVEGTIFSNADFTGVEVPYRLSDDDLSDVIGVGAPGEVVLGSGAWERALVEAGCTKSLGGVGIALTLIWATSTSEAHHLITPISS